MGTEGDLVVGQPLQPQLDDLGLMGLTASNTLQIPSAGQIVAFVFQSGKVTFDGAHRGMEDARQIFLGGRRPLSQGLIEKP